MRRTHETLIAALAIVLIVSGTASADVADPGAPKYTNNMTGGFITPTVRPGDDFEFSFNLTNPYSDPDAVMTGLDLTFGVYRYATQEEVRDVNESFPHAPVVNGEGVQVLLHYDSLGPDEALRVELQIETDRDTPHGSYFSQSTYFVRLRLEFRFEGNDTPVTLQSRGFFTAEEWDTMVSFDEYDSIVNTTYMNSLGVDGLLPDSSFGIKVQIPRWPLALLVGACGLAAFGALYYFVLDNPGRYPRLEKRFYQLRGKLCQLRSQLEHRRGK